MAIILGTTHPAVNHEKRGDAPLVRGIPPQPFNTGARGARKKATAEPVL
jgi:hypothetical protein